MKKTSAQQKQSGFIAILTVIALLAFSLSLTTAVTYLSIGGGQEGLALSQGAATLALSEGCAEDALLQSIRDENYAGGEYSFFGGTCVVDIAKDGTVWTVDVSGTKDGFTRSVQIVFDYVVGTPNTIALVSWQEQ